MRLIDADSLLAEYDRQHEGEPGKARKLIEDAPTIDRPTRSQFKRMAVQLGYEPVVHCKDCKYWKKFNDDMRRDGMCEALLNFHGAERYMTNEEFFCAYGERRTDANEPDGT